MIVTREDLSASELMTKTFNDFLTPIGRSILKGRTHRRIFFVDGRLTLEIHWESHVMQIGKIPAWMDRHRAATLFGI